MDDPKVKITPISDNKCNICWGTGQTLDFSCPLCGGFMYGSSSFADSDNLKRYCHSTAQCRFSWMSYEDYRYFKPNGAVCIACNGSGKESVWIL